MRAKDKNSREKLQKCYPLSLEKFSAFFLLHSYENDDDDDGYGIFLWIIRNFYFIDIFYFDLCKILFYFHEKIMEFG